MPDLVLGADLGTGGCKVTVIDKNGTVVGNAFQEYTTAHPQPGWSEQDPADWITAFRRALSQLVSDGVRLADVAAMAPCAPTHNAVLLDAAGDVLRPSIIWTDQRSGAQVARLQAESGGLIFRLAHQSVNCTWTLPQLAWIRDTESWVWTRIRRLLFTKDYLHHWLTGSWETDAVDAVGTLLTDTAAGRWSEALCALVGLDPTVLPPIVASTTVSGHLTAGAAEATGLPQGLPVVAGSSDSACEVLACGVTSPGHLALKLATAGAVFAFTGVPAPHPGLLTYPYLIPGIWYSVAATNSAAASYRWLRGLSRDPTQEIAYGRMDELAAAVPVGSEGLLFHPYLGGERSPYWDADLRASFVGLSWRHDRGHLARAVLEGVAFSLLDCLISLRHAGLVSAAAPEPARIVGGGARSALWRQITADVLELALVQPTSPDAAYGAALLAGVGAGFWSHPTEAATASVRLSEPILPDPSRVSRYRELFAVYKSVQSHLAADCHRLAAFARASG